MGFASGARPAGPLFVQLVRPEEAKGETAIMGHGRWARGHAVIGGTGVFRLLAASAMLIALLLPAAGAGAAVTNLGGWQFLRADCGTGSALATGEFVNGPGVPPLGVVSFQMSIISSGVGYPQLQDSSFNGTKLSDLTALSYATFVLGFGPQSVSPYLLLEIDQNGDGTVDDELVYQPAAQATVQGQVWQTWDALSGSWWSLRGLAGMGTATAGKPLSNYLAAYPDARIMNVGQQGGFRVAAGCLGTGWSSFDGAVDAVIVGVNNSNTIFDFESDGVHVTSPSTGDNKPDLPSFQALTPAPFSTVSPGDVTISSEITAQSNLTGVTMTLNGQVITPQFSGVLGTDVIASATRSLTPGTYTVTMTATDSNGRAFDAQWDFVVSTTLGDNEWFYANGTPKASQINATMTSLVQAFRWHLFGQSWDGQPHPEMPTHASTVTQAAALSNWVNGSTFDEASTNATLTSLVQAFRWHFWGISWDGTNHPEMPTHASVVLPPESISPWFNADGTPIPQNISATLQSLVQAFRWHFWGYSWDGQHHFTDMPTHGY